MKKLITQNRCRITAVMLVLVLLLPIFLTVTMGVAEASSGSLFGEKTSPIKGLLVVIMAFLLDKIAGEQRVDAKEGDPLVSDVPDNDSSTPYAPVQQYLSQGEKEVMGFYVNWDTPGVESYPSLTRNARNIDTVSPYWYTVTASGEVESKFNGHQPHVMNFTRQQGQLILPLINNDKSSHTMLTNPGIRQRAIDNIVALIQRNHYDGVNIDFEMLPAWTKDHYTIFIRELSQKLRARGKLMTISVFPKVGVPNDIMGAYDYRALAPYVDRMVIMAYDNHWASGPSGAVAPLKWVEQNIIYALREMPASKILLGIANYGYDWPTNGGKGTDIASKKAIELAKQRGATLQWDAASSTPYFYYTSSKGAKRVIWFESSYSLDYKLQLVNKYNLKGIAVWRLGNEEDRFWEIVRKRLNK